MAIYKTGNSYSQFGGAVNITKEIEQLVNPNRGKGTLYEAPKRNAIAPSKFEVIPQGGIGGLVSPLTEQPYAGSTFYQLTSSDGLFVFEFPDQTEYIDAANGSYVFIHLDPNA